MEMQSIVVVGAANDYILFARFEALLFVAIVTFFHTHTRTYTRIHARAPTKSC